MIVKQLANGDIKRGVGRPKGSRNKHHQSLEDRQAYLKNYRETHKQEEKERWQNYKRNNPSKIKAKYINHREENIARTLRHSNIEKIGVLSHYSNDTQKCVRCGFSDIRALTIDHINGGGTKHRKILNKGGTNFYRWLRMNGYPEGYQVLCHNCQWLKRAENREFRKEGKNYKYAPETA